MKIHHDSETVVRLVFDCKHVLIVNFVSLCIALCELTAVVFFITVYPLDKHDG